ncbi:MAG: exonuclease domain-containing protein [Patescibacteria group bacterium]
MQIIFLDTETTGNDLSKDRLCQICYQVGDTLKTEFFKPSLPISVKAMSITHITNKMVADKEPFEGSETKINLQSLLNEGVLVAHNVKFDAAMLESEGIVIPNRICTLRIARYVDSEGLIPEYNLQYLRYYLDLEIDGNAHDAEGDVKVLKAVFERLFSKMRKDEIDDEATIQKMIQISGNPSLYRQFNFGKYKDKKIEEVLKFDKGYLEWLLKSKLESGENDEDWIYTLRHYLGIKVG